MAPCWNCDGIGCHECGYATTPEKQRLFVRMLLECASHEQTAEEAEAELRADGVDVDAFLERVRREVEGAKQMSKTPITDDEVARFVETWADFTEPARDPNDMSDGREPWLRWHGPSRDMCIALAKSIRADRAQLEKANAEVERMRRTYEPTDEELDATLKELGIDVPAALERTMRMVAVHEELAQCRAQLAAKDAEIARLRLTAAQLDDIRDCAKFTFSELDGTERISLESARRVLALVDTLAAALDAAEGH